MMNYNNYNNFGYPAYQGYGYNYNNPVTQPNFTQPLSDADIAELRNSADQFTVKITPEEQKKAICTHKQGNNITLIEDGSGNYTCTICGAKFRDDNLSEADVEDICNQIDNVLNLIRTWYLDIPVSTAQNFYAIAAFIKKIPKLYTLASDNFAKHTGGLGGLQPANQPYGFQQLAMIANPQIAAGGVPMGGGFNGMMNPYYNPQPQAQQPFAQNQPFGQMNMGQQYNPGTPAMNPGFAQQAPVQQPYTNPFGYNGAPGMMMQQPQAQPQAPVQQPAPVQPQAPATPVAPGAPVVNKKVFEA